MCSDPTTTTAVTCGTSHLFIFIINYVSRVGPRLVDRGRQLKAIAEQRSHRQQKDTKRERTGFINLLDVGSMYPFIPEKSTTTRHHPNLSRSICRPLIQQDQESTIAKSVFPRVRFYEADLTKVPAALLTCVPKGVIDSRSNDIPLSASETNGESPDSFKSPSLTTTTKKIGR